MAHAHVKFSRLSLSRVLVFSIGKIRVDVSTLAQTVLVADSTGREFAIIVALSMGNGSHQRTTGNRSGNAQLSGIHVIAPLCCDGVFGILVASEDLGNTEVIVCCEAIKQPLRRSVFLFPGVELECLKPRLRYRKRGLKLPKTR